MTHVRRYFVGATLLAAIAVSAHLMRGQAKLGTTPQPNAVDTSEQTLLAAVASATPMRVTSVTNGTQDYAMDVAYTMRTEEPNTEPSQLELAYTGTLRATPLPSAATDTIWAYAMELTSFTGVELTEKIKAQFRRPFAIRFASNGQVAKIGYSPNMDSLVQNTVRMLAGALQLVRPEKSTKPASLWSTFENDMLGRYLAEYKQPDGLHVSKSKKSYQAFTFLGSSNAQNLAKGNHGTGHVTYEFAQDARLKSVECRDEVSVQMGAGTMTVQASLGLHLSAANADAVALDPEQLAWLDIGKAPAGRGLADNSSSEDSKPVNESAKSLVDKFANVRQLTTVDQVNTANLLARKVAQDPASIPTVVSMLRHLKPGEGTGMVISGLLGAKTAAARDAVFGIAADDTFDPRVRRNAAEALGLDTNANEATVAGLDKLTRSTVGSELHPASALALGAAIDRVVSKGGQAEAGVDTLLGLLAQAKDPNAQRLYVDAVGNSGSPRAYDALSPYLSSDNTSLRVAAMNALRKIPGDQVDGTLATAIVSSSDTLTRNAAIADLGSRPLTPTLVNAVTQVLQGSNESAKLGVLNQISRASEVPAPVITAMQNLVNAGSSAEVIKAAQNILTQSNAVVDSR